MGPYWKLGTTMGLTEKVAFEYHIGHRFSDFNICQTKNNNKDSISPTTSNIERDIWAPILYTFSSHNTFSSTYNLITVGLV